MVVIAGCHAAIVEGRSNSWHLVAVMVPRRVGTLVIVVVVALALAVGIQASECDRRDSFSRMVVGRNNTGVGNRNNSNPVVGPWMKSLFRRRPDFLSGHYGVHRFSAGRCFPLPYDTPQRREMHRCCVTSEEMPSSQLGSTNVDGYSPKA